jgi:hypothetical protein
MNISFPHRRLSVAFALVLALAPASFAAGPSSRGVVVYFEGEVRVNGSAVDIGLEVGPAIRVETGPASFCEIVFDDKNAIRVTQNSDATLDLSGLRKRVDLKKGGVTSVLRKLKKVAFGDSYTIATSTAVAAVRGTSFCVWADSESTYVCACNGSVRTVDAKGANSRTLASSHHTARIYARKGASIELSEAGLEHHGDGDIETLAARIGESVDWSRIDK